MLLAWLFEALPPVCLNCEADTRIIARTGEPTGPPSIASACLGSARSCSAWVPAHTRLWRSHVWHNDSYFRQRQGRADFLDSS